MTSNIKTDTCEHEEIDMQSVYTTCPMNVKVLNPTIPKAEKRKLYDQWAPTYDQDSTRGGNKSRSICAKMLVEIIEDLSKVKRSKPLRLLDTCCGAGGLGKLLRVELNRLDIPLFMMGLDYSEGMLEQARMKQCYDQLVNGDITMSLPEEAHNMDIVVILATFVDGHVDASALPNVLKCMHKNGTALITIRSTTLAKKEAEYLKAVDDSHCEIVQSVEQPYLGPANAHYWTIKKLE